MMGRQAANRAGAPPAADTARRAPHSGRAADDVVISFIFNGMHPSPAPVVTAVLPDISPPSSDANSGQPFLDSSNRN